MQKHISLLFDLLFLLVGAAMVIVAAFMIYTPLGFIVVGAIACLVGYVRRVIAWNRGVE